LRTGRQNLTLFRESGCRKFSVLWTNGVDGKANAMLRHENFPRGLQRGNCDQLFGLSYLLRLLARVLTSGRFGSCWPWSKVEEKSIALK